ncbi:MAG: type II secretion system F family protein [Planctomycetota bacterium]
MPIFEYKAYAPGGATKAGVIDADSAKDARSRLRRDNLLVSQIQEVARRGRSKNPAKAAKDAKVRRPGVVDRYLEHRRMSRNGATGRDVELVSAITRQMGTLLGAGIPLSDALKAIIDQSESRRIESLFRELRERITQGTSLADALAEHPELFGDLYVNMVRAGEATGQVDIVLSRLADFIQAQRAMQRKVVSALTYPLMMMALGVVVVGILMTVVVPKITGMLEDSGQQLPATTQALMTVSGLFQNYWWLGLLGLAAISSLIGRLYRTKKGRLLIDRNLLRAPIFGELLRKRAVSRFTRTLSTLLSSGVAAVQALEITRDVVGNRVIADATEVIRSRILEGTDIATPLQQSGVFPAVVGYMVAVGEQSGELETMLDRIADAYDEEVEVVSERVLSVLEPMMIVVLACVVGFIVLSIIQPILQVGAIK